MKKRQPFNAETALRIYYAYPNEIGNTEIKELFNVSGSSTVAAIKKAVRKLMEEKEIKVWNPRNVDTKTTYEYAGIDIAAVERSYLKMKKLGLEVRNETNRRSADPHAYTDACGLWAVETAAHDPMGVEEAEGAGI